ncbi:MAG: hypothetical protein ACE5JZ_07680 [Kiloniellales bacterium]
MADETDAGAEGAGIVTVVAFDPFRGRELVLLNGAEEVGRIPLADWMTHFLIKALQRSLTEHRSP